MKRFVLMFIALFVFATAAGFAASAPTKSKATVKKVSRLSDQTLIKQAVLAWDDRRLHRKATALSAVKFDKIKISAGWATTIYLMLDSQGKTIPTGEEMTFILKKVKGAWKVATKSETVALDVDQCKSIGLPFETAKKLQVAMFWD